jgi:hypothetical protein
MNRDPLPLTSNQLGIRNPMRIFGLVQILTASFLGYLFSIRLPGQWPAMEQYVRQLLAHPGKLVADALEQPTSLGLPIVTLFAASAVLVCVFNIAQGLANIVTFFVPTGVPKGIDASHEVVPRLFVERTITSYAHPRGVLKYLAALFSKRFLSVTPTQRRLVASLVQAGPRWLVLLAVAAALEMPRDSLLWLAAAAGGTWLVLWMATLACLPPPPDVQVLEAREHVVNSGNPINYFNHVRYALDLVRRDNFPNRLVIERPPAVARTAQGQTDAFQSELVVESQPLPEHQGFPTGAALLDLGGALLRCAGYALTLSMNPVIATEAELAPFLFRLIAAFLTLRSGTHLLNLGLHLHQVYRFHSDLFQVQLTGTCTASAVGLGDGQDGQLYSQRVVIQSDTYLHLHASRIYTECVGLEADRIIVDSRADPELRQLFKKLRQAMLDYQDTGNKLAEIDLSEPSISRLVKANAEIRSLQARAAAGLLPAPSENPEVPALGKPGGEGTPPAEASGIKKSCPDCGEPVSVSARKCHRCGCEFAP